jgi:hypothetical protein
VNLELENLLLLEGSNQNGHEYIEHKERHQEEEHIVNDGDLKPIIMLWAHVLLVGVRIYGPVDRLKPVFE